MLKSFEEVPAASPPSAGAAPARRSGSWAALAVAALVAACGGGGGGSSSTSLPTITDFPLQAAYKAFLIRGNSQQFGVTGNNSCNGTALLVTKVPRDVTFEGRPAKAIDYSNDIALGTACPYQISGATGVQYFDAVAPSDYGALGVVDSQGYGRYESPPGTLKSVPLPASVRAGDGGMLGTQYLYTDAALGSRKGRTDLSYQVTADNPGVSVLVALTTATYDTGGTLFSRQVNTYRLNQFGSFTPLRSDIDFPALTPPLQLVLTAP